MASKMLVAAMGLIETLDVNRRAHLVLEIEVKEGTVSYWYTATRSPSR